MAQSDVTQEPQFKVLGADSVKFTITEVDDDAQQIHVSINCSELTTQPDFAPVAFAINTHLNSGTVSKQNKKLCVLKVQYFLFE